jgi:hypothetical protein
MTPDSFVPLPLDSTQTNGGQRCDMAAGPCACGAWHEIEESARREMDADRMESAHAAMRDHRDFTKTEDTYA